MPLGAAVPPNRDGSWRDDLLVARGELVVQASLIVEWVYGFYERQGMLTGLYSGDPDDYYQGQAARIRRLAPDAATVLELAAGGGQAAAVTADDGLTVTAVELVSRAAANARRLAATRPGLTVLEADMYTVDLGDAHFDAVVYWDGFGIGTDRDQLVLLRRIREWMDRGGRLLLDVYTPWYWAAAAGHESSHGTARSRYGFDPYGCRMLDRWWDSEAGGEDDAVEQSLRCYSPADLALLADAVGLRVTTVEPHGAVDYRTGNYEPEVPLHRAMSYTAVITVIDDGR